MKKFDLLPAFWKLCEQQFGYSDNEPMLERLLLTLALPTLIVLCSVTLKKTVQSSLVVLGEITISGTMLKVDELANTLQVCPDSGAKKILLPSTSFVDFSTIPPELMSEFQLIPYQSAEDAVFKALGVE